MPIKHVIINASPLITLYKSQLADLLPQLFGQVSVPPAVWREVTACKNDFDFCANLTLAPVTIPKPAINCWITSPLMTSLTKSSNDAVRTAACLVRKTQHCYTIVLKPLWQSQN